jgi:hypothetical protein
VYLQKLALVFLESTFIDQNNPTRHTAGPLVTWGSPKLPVELQFKLALSTSEPR